MEQTYVACLKGKQHKASCKSKIQNSITQPLFMLHMDLFGPTFVSSLMNKKYCLVVTNDYSRFTWVFFLATKDETSGILKSFITEKGIKREFSVARTPQQNGVAERRNRTLIEAARTMVLVVKPHNKTPYELFRGDGPKWLFDIDVLTKSMNYVPVVAGTNSNDSVGTEESIGTGHSSKETESSQDCILMPLWKDGSLFDSSLNNASNDEPQPSSDAGKKDDEDNATLDATHADFFGDETEVDMSNITTTYLGLFMKGNHDGPSLLSVLLVSYPRKSQKGPWWIYHLAKIAPWYLMGDTGQEDERVARIEAIRLFLAYASFKDFVVYQMDVKSAFLHGKIEEEVQSVNSRMSSMGELTFFLGLQLTQKDDGIFISQEKYVDEILKKFSFSTVKTESTHMETSKPLLKDAEAEDVDVHLYRSMIGSLMYLTASMPDIIQEIHNRRLQFLGSRLISWQCKKQIVVANSTTKAEYVTAASLLWTIKNLVFNSKTKHIEIRHHFIKDSNKKKLIQMIKIHKDQNVAELLTKAFDVGRFQYLIANTSPSRWEEGDRIETSVRRALQLNRMLKERVNKLKRRNKSRTPGLKRLKKVGRTTRIESSEDEGLGAQEDASKQGRKIADLDVDAEVTLVDEARERNDDNLIFDTGVFDEFYMMEADYELAQKLQAEKQGELTIEERSKLFVELMDKSKKYFAKLRAEDIRRKPPTKAQKRNQMYSFVPMDTKVVEGSKKRTREELESDNSKKQKIDDNVEAEVDDEAGMK
ncbi:putative ribonuclease H-like domain-containing protein [Tanacetum coccineum]